MSFDSSLIRFSLMLFLVGMVLGGVLFLPITDTSLKAQVETFTGYIITTSLVTLAIVGISALFKRKF